MIQWAATSGAAALARAASSLTRVAKRQAVEVNDAEKRAKDSIQGKLALQGSPSQMSREKV